MSTLSKTTYVITLVHLDFYCFNFGNSDVSFHALIYFTKFLSGSFHTYTCSFKLSNEITLVPNIILFNITILYYNYNTVLVVHCINLVESTIYEWVKKTLTFQEEELSYDYLDSDSDPTHSVNDSG